MPWLIAHENESRRRHRADAHGPGRELEDALATIGELDVDAEPVGLDLEGDRPQVRLVGRHVGVDVIHLL